MFWFFECKACGILVPWLGIKPTPPASEGKILSTEHQGMLCPRPLLTTSLPKCNTEQGVFRKCQKNFFFSELCFQFPEFFMLLSNYFSCLMEPNHDGVAEEETTDASTLHYLILRDNTSLFNCLKDQIDYPEMDL